MVQDFSNKTDEELVKLTLEDKENFVFIVSRYKIKLYYYVKRLTNIPEEEIEDVLQDVFLKIYLNLNDFDSNLKFSSWIYRITRNEVISQHRKRLARPLKSDIAIEDEKIENIAHDFNIAEEIDRRSMHTAIYETLSSLEEKYKEVLILKFLEEKDYKEISDIIGKPVGTVGSRINQARKIFINKFSRYKL